MTYALTHTKLPFSRIEVYFSTALIVNDQMYRSVPHMYHQIYLHVLEKGYFLLMQIVGQKNP